MVFAHIRASTGGAIQQTNCHPFRHDNWLWMHNGVIHDFSTVKRDLVLAVDPALYPHIEGNTDSETFFFLALTFGLREDPVGAVERAAGFIEQTCRAHGIAEPLQMTVAAADGDRLWAFRYSSEHTRDRCSSARTWPPCAPSTRTTPGCWRSPRRHG